MIRYLLARALDSAAALTALAIAAAVLLYRYSTRTYGKWRALNVPHPRPVPLFGNAMKRVLTLEKQTELFDRIYRLFPDARLCGFYQMRTPYLMVRDPALIAAVTVSDFAHFTDHGFEIDPSVNLLARSVFFSDGRRWRTMRQKLSPAFTSGKLRGTHGQIKQCADQLMTVLDRKRREDDGGRVEVKKAVGNFATDVIGTCAFGLTLHTITNDESDFRRYASNLFRAGGALQICKNIVVMLFPGLAKLLRMQLFPTDATDFFHSVFSDVIKYRTENNVVRNDLAQTLMQARKELVLNEQLTGEEKFTDLDIIANAILLFSAGADTVSITTSFCLYELALRRDIQDKLRGEINLAKKKYDGKFTSDFLMDLQYAEMVLNETLRKYSITIALLRVATQDYQVPGESLVIKKGQKIVIPSFSIHHDPKYYPNPDDFDPERFTAEEKSKRPNGTFIPFGDGPRQCIAKRFAELEMKLVLSEILSKFEVLPCEKTEIPLEMKIGPGLLEPKNGIWLSFKPIVE